ncbi:MAG: tetratricopeptide repeat protein [Ghiorsea sp.]|nr:tetratricopeptide repeat protein [Ghiorsea sp.]
MKALLSLLFIASLAGAGLYFTGSNDVRGSSDSDMMQLGNFAYQEKRYEDAFKWYENAANQGIAEAQFRLSQMYQKGEGVDKDETAATHWLFKAASQGVAQAEYEYAIALEFGRGIKRAQMKEVAVWYEKAAQHAYPEAMLKVAKLYFSGSGINKDIQQALTWALKAKNKHVADADTFLKSIIQEVKKLANQGDYPAQHMLALMHQRGQAVEKDPKLALVWLRKAASKGHADAQYDLGRTLAQTDPVSALYWLQKAANSDHAQAGYMAAALMATQHDTKQKNVSDAWRWLYHGKQMDQPKVVYNLAIALHQGQLGLPETNFKYQTWLEQAARGGVTASQNDYAVDLVLHRKSVKKAVFWLRKAAQNDVKSQFNLGLIYARGDGITPDDDAAIQWWKQAAENDSARAKMMLGLFYNLGRGVGRSEKEAVHWYEQAAKLGDNNASYNLGVLYYNGRGIDRDYNKAAAFFHQLAKNGDTAAQNMYASLFLEGQGVKYSPKNAVRWFRKAASAGNIKAMFNLATQYRTGVGIKQDDKKALFWYKKAAMMNFAPAQNAMGYMYAQGRGTKVDKDAAEVWFEKASDNGLSLAVQNSSALKQHGSFALLRLQIDNSIRSDVLTDKTIDLSTWLEPHQQAVL